MDEYVEYDEYVRNASSAPGEVWVWGNNLLGQVGDGTKDPRRKHCQEL